MLQDAADAMVRFQDRQTGMFWQVVDKPGVPGNYLETSGSALFAYAMLKGVRLGVLPARYAQFGKKAFYGTCDNRLGVDLRTATSSSAASAWWQGWAARPIGTAALPTISANRSWRTTPRV